MYHTNQHLIKDVVNGEEWGVGMELMEIPYISDITFM